MNKAENEKTRTDSGQSDGRGSGKSGANTGRRYGEATKRQVVEEIESGRLTVVQAQRQYGIAGSQTVYNWLSKYGTRGGSTGTRPNAALAAAQTQIDKLKREKAELEHALARSAVKVVVLESVIEEAEALYGDDLKKKSNPQPSSGRASGCGRRK